jgi:GNAT superfamily N-acetyltransferase
VKVALLADHPECRETLAAWYLREWPWLFDATSTPFQELDAGSNRDYPPCTLVGFEGPRLVASAALLNEDALPFPEYTPLLGSVVVDPEHRDRGLGREIVLAAMEHARRIGIVQIFLWTPHHRHFYEKLGWEFVRDYTHENRPSSILRIPFDRNPANPECPA